MLEIALIVLIVIFIIMLIVTYDNFPERIHALPLERTITCEQCGTDNLCYIPVDVAWWCAECCNPIYKGREYKKYTRAIENAKKRHEVWALENREEM